MSATAKSGRIASIDIIRGIAIVGMVLCANIGFQSDLPAWMFHAQTPPPTYAFNPEVPGITWVDRPSLSQCVKGLREVRADGRLQEVLSKGGSY